ncbi:hypothetical protein ScPMuIL_009313 [Solemya velum]
MSTDIERVCLQGPTTLWISCYQCEDLHYNGSTGGISLIRDALDKLRSPDCAKPLSELSEGSLSDRGIDSKVCGQAPPGKVYKCGYMTGRLQAKFLLITFPVNIFVRDCLAVSADLQDGCHVRRNQPEDANVLGGVFGTLSSLGVTNFIGEMCVCSDNMCGASAGLGVSTYLLPFLVLVHLVKHGITGA